MNRVQKEPRPASLADARINGSSVKLLVLSVGGELDGSLHCMPLWFIFLAEHSGVHGC